MTATSNSLVVAARTARLQKSLGAFYTGQPAARRLVEWAICESGASVLDPSCGDGAFLDAANSRLLTLGSDVPELYGVDISPETLQFARERVGNAKLVQSDFFALTTDSLPTFDCVVGNPPFIRYQTFNENKESLGHLRAKEAGVNLPRLASSWAPFVIHAARFLRAGGRLGMVMPSELGHAKYAREVLRFLVENFRHVAIEMFRDKLFDDLSQSTVLLFCDGYGEQSRTFIVASSEGLEGAGRRVDKVDITTVKDGRFRFTRYLVSPAVRELYDRLALDKRVQRLGSIADVGIGYVTGANEFFHLSLDEGQRWGIPRRFLRPCLPNLRGFSELAYTPQDWAARRDRGEKVYLLALPSVPAESLPKPIQQYLKWGERLGFAQRYKCHIREYWHAVPHIRIADAFLAYMSGEQPLLVTNAANLVVPNTIHVLRFDPACDALSYAASWRSSLTWLSCELEGHALGGGLFKLEPSEAENILVVRPRKVQSRNLIAQLVGGAIQPEQANKITDRHLLKHYLGLTQRECVLLSDAARELESWRKHQ